MKIIYHLLMIVNGVFGVVNVYLAVDDKIKALNFAIFAANLIVLYAIRRDISSVVVAVLTYPLGLFTPIWINREPFFKSFWNGEKGYGKFRSSKYLNSMPLKVISKLGSVAQKKAAILEIKELVKKGIEVRDNVKMLTQFLSSENQDVALYASEAINEIEGYYVEEIAKLEHDSKPEAVVKFCYMVLNVIKTDLIVGRLKDYYENVVVEKAELIKESHPVDYHIIMYEATSNIKYLEEGFEETSSDKLLSLLFIQTVKERKYTMAHEIASQFPEIVEKITSVNLF